MAIPVTCETCSSRMNAPDHAAGRMAKCPKCSASILVPNNPRQNQQNLNIQPPVSPKAEITPKPYNPIVENPPKQMANSQPATKQCDFCGEEIIASAKKCKHCGEILDPALRAADEARRMAEIASKNANSNLSAASAFSNSTTVVVNNNLKSRSFPHFLHLVMTVLTLGLWLPIWILHYIFRSR